MNAFPPSRSINVRHEAGAWFAEPSEDTTVGELQLAVEVFDLTVIIDGGVIMLVRREPANEPPTTEELARIMFGDAEDVVTVEETGKHKKIDEDAEPAIPVG